MSTKPHLTQIQSSNMEKYPHLLNELLELYNIIGELESKGIKEVFATYADMVAGAEEIGFYRVIVDETFNNYPTVYYYDGNNLIMNYGLNLLIGTIQNKIDVIEDDLVELNGEVEGIVSEIGDLKLEDIRLSDILDLVGESLEELQGTVNDNIESIQGLEAIIGTTSRDYITLKEDLFEIMGDWENDPGITDKLIKGIGNVRDIIGVEGLRRTVVFFFQNYYGGEKVVEIYVPYNGKLDKLYLTISEEATETLEGVLEIDGREFEITIPVGEKIATLELDDEFSEQRIRFKILSGEEGIEGINATLDFIQVN